MKFQEKAVGTLTDFLLKFRLKKKLEFLESNKLKHMALKNLLLPAKKMFGNMLSFGKLFLTVLAIA